MMTRRDWALRVLLTIASTLLVTAFVAAASPQVGSVDPAALPYVRLARADLAARLDLPVQEIALREVAACDFPDSSLGVPEEGELYLTVITPGYVVELTAGGQRFTYHGGNGRVILAG